MQKQKFLTANCEYEMLKMLEVSGGKSTKMLKMYLHQLQIFLSLSVNVCPRSLSLLHCLPLSILLRLALSAQVQLNLPSTDFELISHAAHRGVGSTGDGRV